MRCARPFRRGERDIRWLCNRSDSLIERDREFRRARVARVDVVGEGACEKRVESDGQGRIALSHGNDAPGAHVLQKLVGLNALNGQLAGQRFVRKGGKSPKIAAVIEGSRRSSLLWAHVPWSAEDNPFCSRKIDHHQVRVHDASDAEVEHFVERFAVLVLSQKDVGRFQIAVQDAFAVGMLEGTGDVLDQFLRIRGR